MQGLESYAKLPPLDSFPQHWVDHNFFAGNPKFTFFSANFLLLLLLIVFSEVEMQTERAAGVSCFLQVPMLAYKGTK